jgi:amidophosphoribosyltransferase
MQELHEKCGVFGAYCNNLEAARLVHMGLWALQHRGQEGSGIVSADGKSMYAHKGMGLVASVYSEPVFSRLRGHIAIGHNRYSTSGGNYDDHLQPVFRRGDRLALAHNGNLADVTKLSRFLHEHGHETDGCNDSEMMHKAIMFWLIKGLTIGEALTNCIDMFTGVYSLLLMTAQQLVAVRDPFGVRPLSLGHLEDGFAVASESCALTPIGATSIREIRPGEMVTFDQHGMHTAKLRDAKPHLDVFEFVYFARPDSVLGGVSVNEVRERSGHELASELDVDCDVIVPVPDSAIPAAIGFAEKRDIAMRLGIVKNRYIDRTFIKPVQRMRDDDVMIKLNPIPDVLRGKRVAIVDDSIVRGTTSKKIVRMARRAGAKEVHVVVSSPPVRFPDFYGIDTPVQQDLLAARMTIPEMCEFIGADSLHFLSLNGLLRAVGIPREQLCLSLFTGEYPVDIGNRKAEVQYFAIA